MTNVITDSKGSTTLQDAWKRDGPAVNEEVVGDSWASAFSAACWVSPIYLTDLGGANDGNDEQPEERASMKTPEDLREEREVLGWTIDAVARGAAVMGTAVFVSSELLRLAKIAAGCEIPDDESIVFECEERIYGMRPSSILTNIVMVVGLCSACFMPLIGSIIDHTPYRREIGAISAALFTTFILIQMLVMQKFWFLAAILQVFIACSYTVHLVSVYSYLPELTTDHDKMVHYTARFAASQYAGSLTFLVAIVGISMVVNRDGRFLESHLSQTVVFIVCTLCFGYAWTNLFGHRPARQEIPEGQNLISSGFRKLYGTARDIALHHTAIKWLLLSVALTEAAATTFSTVAITYMTDVLGFTAHENGIAILIMLVFGLPGTKLAAWLTKRFNPIRSLQACLALWIINTTCAAIFLKQANQEILTYFFAMVWGVGIGWIVPSEKTLYVTIIPQGQEAELMGIFICACQVLSWLPPLVFSIMNELQFSMRVSLFGLTIYFLASFFILFLVGDYKDAVLHAKEIDESRRDFSCAQHGNAGKDHLGGYDAWEDVEDDISTRRAQFSARPDATCGVQLLVPRTQEIEEDRMDLAKAPPSGLGIDSYGCYQEWVEIDTPENEISGLCGSEICHGGYKNM